MIAATIGIAFDGEWLIAGGESVLGTADLAPMKDDDGFPFVPGRSLRGLLREAVSLVDDCTGGQWAHELFGERLVPGGDRHYREGTARIGNALLVHEIADACGAVELRRELYTTVRRTALTHDHLARAHTLRELEVCVPGLVLSAEIEVPDDTSLRVLAFACGLVRSLGHGRSRGLGRCSIEICRDGTPVECHEIPVSTGERNTP